MNEKNILYNQPQDDLRQIWFGIKRKVCIELYQNSEASSTVDLDYFPSLIKVKHIFVINVHESH